MKKQLPKYRLINDRRTCESRLLKKDICSIVVICRVKNTKDLPMKSLYVAHRECFRRTRFWGGVSGYCPVDALDMQNPSSAAFEGNEKIGKGGGNVDNK